MPERKKPPRKWSGFFGVDLAVVNAGTIPGVGEAITRVAVAAIIFAAIVVAPVIVTIVTRIGTPIVAIVASAWTPVITIVATPIRFFGCCVSELSRLWRDSHKQARSPWVWPARCEKLSRATKWQALREASGKRVSASMGMSLFS